MKVFPWIIISNLNMKFSPSKVLPYMVCLIGVAQYAQCACDPVCLASSSMSCSMCSSIHSIFYWCVAQCVHYSMYWLIYLMFHVCCSVCPLYYTLLNIIILWYSMYTLLSIAQCTHYAIYCSIATYVLLSVFIINITLWCCLIRQTDS